MKIRDYNKSTIEEIEEKFDNQVHRYSDINTGQETAMDSVLIMELVSRMAIAAKPEATHILDIGCGAGNYTLKILEKIPGLNCTLIDLSKNMLNKAKERIREKTKGEIKTIHSDIREVEIEHDKYDIVVAATSLHHLRDDDEWITIFKRIYNSLKPNGAFFISDLILYDNNSIDQEAWNDYWEYLDKKGGEKLKNWVYEHIDKEDTPRSLNYITGLLKETGFRQTEIFYRRSVFAALCGIK